MIVSLTQRVQISFLVHENLFQKVYVPFLKSNQFWIDNLLFCRYEKTKEGVDHVGVIHRGVVEGES